MSLLTQCLKACSSLSWVRPKVAAGNSIHISYTDGRDPNICYITCRMLNSTMLEAEEMQHEPRDSDICISSDGFNALSNVQPWRKICHKVKQVLRAAVNSGSIFNVSLPSVFCDRGFSPNRAQHVWAHVSKRRPWERKFSKSWKLTIFIATTNLGLAGTRSASGGSKSFVTMQGH